MKKYKLGDLIDIRRGASLSGEYYSSEGELMRLTLGHFDYQNGGFKENTSKNDLFFVGPVKSEFILSEGDIITPLTEQTPGLLGSTAMIPESDKYIQSQDVALITPDESKLDRNFCYYLLPSKIVKQQLAAGAQQTKIRHTTPDRIKDLTVFIPSLPEQKAIGKLLKCVDQKIALNREINRNLEAMARQLYDYWFVQFDFPDENGKPYKSSGGKMAWDEKLKRDIPEDWKSNKISEIAKTYSGGTPTSSNKDYYDSKDVPWINSGELNESFITATDNYISEFGLNNSSAKIYPANSILVALYGATAGKVSFLSFEASSNQAVCGVIPNHANLTEYLYIALSSLCKYYISLSTGSARDNISQATVKDTLLLFPNNKILGEFHILASKIFDKIINCQLEILNLTKQRDELLPLMMSSQVSVMPSEVNCDLVA